MKKSLLVMFSFLLIQVTAPAQEVQSEDAIQTIPDDAIRLRILANSDEEKDQAVKHLVRDEVSDYISDLVIDIDEIRQARQMIRGHLPEIRAIVEETLAAANHETVPYTVDYSANITFPMKLYDHYLYPAGEYEAVLITLGAGQGANWWCVLFPPLCFLDFSNGSTVETEEERADPEIDAPAEKADDPAEEPYADEQEIRDDEEDEEVEITFFLFEWLGIS